MPSAAQRNIWAISMSSKTRVWREMWPLSRRISRPSRTSRFPGSSSSSIFAIRHSSKSQAWAAGFKATAKVEAISRGSPTADGQITGGTTNLYNGPRCIQIAVLLHHGTEAVKVSETAERPTSDIKREDYRDQQAQLAQPDEAIVHCPLPVGPLQLVVTAFIT